MCWSLLIFRSKQRSTECHITQLFCNLSSPSQKRPCHVSSPHQQQHSVRITDWLFTRGRIWTLGIRIRYNGVCCDSAILIATLRAITDPRQNRYDYVTSQISADVAQQCDQAFRNIHAALKEAGAEMKDVVRVHYLLADRRDFAHCWPILQKWLGEVRPAATMCQAGLMEEVMKIEIEVTAHMLE